MAPFFQVNLVQVFLLHLFSNRMTGISGMGLFMGRCPSCHPTISIKSLKGAYSTKPNQSPGLIFSSSKTKLWQKVLIPFYWLSDASTIQDSLTVSQKRNKLLYLYIQEILYDTIYKLQTMHWSHCYWRHNMQHIVEEMETFVNAVPILAMQGRGQLSQRIRNGDNAQTSGQSSTFT